MASEFKALPPPPDQEEFDAELHRCFLGDGAMTGFAKWRGVDKSQVSREVSARYPDQSIFWKFLREGLDPLFRADRDTAERVWAVLARFKARYSLGGKEGQVHDFTPAIFNFVNLAIQRSEGEPVSEAELTDAANSALEGVAGLRDALGLGDEAEQGKQEIKDARPRAVGGR